MFKEYNRDQDFLLPPSFGELIPAGDLVNIIAEVVDRFDLKPFTKRYDPLGQNAYHPRMMLALLFYAYSQGVFSSRKIAERVHYDVRFMFIAGHQTPDFRTIADFRKNHIDLMPRFFRQILHVCRELGLLQLRMVAIDGTKIKARASSEKVKSRDALSKELKEIDAEVARLLAWAQQTDDRESADSAEAEVNQLTGLEIANRRELQAKLREALERLDEEPGRDNINLTDPDCRNMKGVGPAYNAQLAVDEGSGLIVGTDVVTENNDVHQLVRMVDEVDFNTDNPDQAKIILADCGYGSAEAYTKLEARPHIDAYVPTRLDVSRGGQEASPFDKSRFSLDPQTRCGTCPLGQPMRYLKSGVNKSKQAYIGFIGTACPNCPRRTECTKARYRNVVLLLANPAIERMQEKMQTAMGQRAMAIRRQTVEPTIGILKEHMSFRRFHLHGLAKTRGEFALLCVAFNLKKLHRWLGGRAVAKAKCLLFTILRSVVRSFGPIQTIWPTRQGI
jgi:transposase